MSDTEARTAREEWGSRFGFLMAMLGAMVGAGNIWRMPFTAGENGGGAFLLAYVVLLYLIAVPGLMAETMLGRYTNAGVIGTFKRFFGSKSAQGLGLVVLLVNVGLMSYYAPVIGWTLYYAIQSLLLTFSQPGFDAVAFWEGFSGSPLLVIAIHTLTMAGLPSAYSSSFLGRMDFVFGNFGLPLATLAIITLVGWKFGPERGRVIDLNRNAGFYVGAWWNPIVKYVIPVLMAFIIGYGVYDNIGTENEANILLGVAVMVALVVASAAAMSVLGTAGDGDSVRPEGGD